MIKVAFVVVARWIRQHLEMLLGFVLGVSATLLVPKRNPTNKPESKKAESLEQKVNADVALHDAVKDPPYPVESLDEIRKSLRARGILK